jgi:tryptophan synthase alpha subunit
MCWNGIDGLIIPDLQLVYADEYKAILKNTA